MSPAAPCADCEGLSGSTCASAHIVHSRDKGASVATSVHGFVLALDCLQLPCSWEHACRTVGHGHCMYMHCCVGLGSRGAGGAKIAYICTPYSTDTILYTHTHAYGSMSRSSLRCAV